ncbi:MAG: helix-turn-helix domain-containing protein [Hyphomicrobium sp.]|jgi:hypothetical protein|uniref:helix-turn-helix domain-containing protein n=1 Tax=Hyphomicrobium sp. TaxID=82 RepID=UPI0025C4DDD3|nr:helix-turn-helix domain-containing protein [Hyphomicrobium sp.]MBX9865137.1 helix-turn-helix domain-containing protein [Hyphomicrobium sp.]
MTLSRPLKSDADFKRVEEPEARSETYLTTSEAAAVVRLASRTLERLRLEGKGPKYLKAGSGRRSRVLYRRVDLIDWIEKRGEYLSTSEY